MLKKSWHEKVAYQIYPKSFHDTNADGVGDLPGIISKLDYLKELGVDIVWISPIYRSPFVDQGYDISDYYSIDPIFGSMEDMEQLIAEAKKRNIAILMDLVVNHCSDKHEWFQKAMKDPKGEYGDFFYIREGKGDKPPCNWRSYFGGSAWEKIPGTNLYYLHSFAKEQPDLNWENPRVKEEVYKMMNWWLEKGLAGFRVDAIINIKKDTRFLDYPADRPDGTSSITNMLEKTTGVKEMLMELKRETFDKHNAFSIGELFNFKKEELASYIGENGCFSSIFNFDLHLLGRNDAGWYKFRSFTPNELRETLYKSQKEFQDIGFMANVIENHDEPRGASNFLPEEDCNETSKKMLAAIFMMMKGLPFIYQGQELGMTNSVFHSIDDFNDISTKDEYKVALAAGYSEAEALAIVSKYSRDNARTPFQWNNGKNAGFSEGSPWFAVNPNYKEINAENQISDPNSVLSFYKQLICLRKTEEYKDAVVYGEFEPCMEQYKNLIAFYRKGENKKLLLIANYQNSAQKIFYGSEIPKILLNNYESLDAEGSSVLLKPYQVVILDA